MKNLLITCIAFITLLFVFQSCKDESTTPEPVANNAYMGDWEGSYTGGDNGTWTMTADKDGKFTGQLYSNNAQTSYPLNGSVDKNGVFNADIVLGTDTIDFKGQGADGKTASGTWSNERIMINGTWTGSKK